MELVYDVFSHKLLHMAFTDWPGIGWRMERKFYHYGVTTTAELYQLTRPEMVEVFGSINGERWGHLMNKGLP